MRNGIMEFKEFTRKTIEITGEIIKKGVEAAKSAKKKYDDGAPARAEARERRRLEAAERKRKLEEEERKKRYFNFWSYKGTVYGLHKYQERSYDTVYPVTEFYISNPKRGDEHIKAEGLSRSHRC